MFNLSPKNRRQRVRLELRESILEAAQELFLSDGYKGFSMRKLARDIKYSPASIYQHFKSKDEILACLVDRSFAALASDLSATSPADHSDAVIALRTGLRRYVALGLTHPAQYRLSFVVERPARARANSPGASRPAFEGLRRKVARCITEGRFKTIDVDVATQALWAAAHGITSLLILRPYFPWVDQDRLIGQVVDGMIDGMLRKQSP